MAADELTKLYPNSLKKFLDKKVSITLNDSTRIYGWVYTIDPVTYCVVIVPTKDGISSKVFLNSTRQSVMFVMGHGIKSIHIDQGDSHLQKPNFKDIFQAKNCKLYSEDELNKRKTELAEWLNKNRIPVEEQGDAISVMGVLWIDPPYQAESCRCTNEIVLNRVQSLIRKLSDLS